MIQQRDLEKSGGIQGSVAKPRTTINCIQMMDQHTLDFLSKQLDHGPLVVDFYQHTQLSPLLPLSELIVLYEPNQDMEMMFNKQ
jgi:hypothetical protein